MADQHRMLLVDDEDDNLEYLVRIFHRTYDVTCARSAKEALEALRKERFDVIITDQLMPDLSGVELLQRSLELNPDAVRIVVTGYPDIETAIASLNEGRAFRFFTKPLDSTQLADSVKRALGEQALERENRRLVEELKVKNDLLQGLVNEKDALIEAKVDARTQALREEIERMRTQLLQDADSGALTEQVFVGRLEEEIARATRHVLPCALVSVRLVGLGEYDEHHGSERTAELLKMVFELLRLGSRRYDVIGRLRVDRFLVLLPMSNADGAEARAGRLREGLLKFPFPGTSEVPSFRFVVTTAGFPEEGREPDALVAVLDKKTEELL